MFLLLLILTPAADTPPTKEALAALRKHCAACHGEKPKHAALNVLDRAGLFAKRLVVPGKPDESELMALLDTGTMPPAGRERPAPAEREAVRRWIEAGAPDVPAPPAIQTGEAYVLGEIARDWDAKKPAGVRYVSLDHLLLGPGGEKRLADARKDLERILAASAGPGKSGFKLTPIDRQESVFRLDLDALGWDVKPFDRSDLNAFDVLLLEYPYGVVALDAPAFARLLPMLRKTKPVRPVPYVRGDWLMAALTDDRGSDPRLSDEWPALLGHAERREKPEPPGKAAWDWEVTPQRALQEVGGKVSVEDWEAATKAAGVADLTANAVTREEWETAFPKVVRALKRGEPVVPLDGLYADAPVEGSVKLSVTTKDAATFKDALSFKAGAKLALLLRPEADAQCEVVIRHRRARRVGIFRGPAAYRGGADTFLPPAGGTPYDLGAAEDEVDVIVFSVASDGKARLPAGVRLVPRAKAGVRERVVHPLYQIADDGKSFAGPRPERVGKLATTVNVMKP